MTLTVYLFEITFIPLWLITGRSSRPMFVQRELMNGRIESFCFPSTYEDGTKAWWIHELDFRFSQIRYAMNKEKKYSLNDKENEENDI